MTQPQDSRSDSGWLTLSVVCLVSVLISLNMNTLNIALPTLARQFQATPSEASWLLLAFMVTNCALLIPFGRITDIVGQRPMYLWGLGVFIVSGFLCGLAPNVEVLIGLRALQAAASAVLLANGATLIHEAIVPSRLSQALGFYTASFSVAALVGPTVGGLVAEVGGWRWIFWFSLPLSVPAFFWGLWKLRGRPRRAERPALDVTGNAVLLVILGLGTYAISRGADVGWGSPTIVIPAVIAVVLVPVLVAVERRASEPILSTEVLVANGVGPIYLAGFLNGAARFPVVIVMGLYFQAVLEQSVVVAAVHLLPVPIGMIATATLLGQFAKRFSPRTLATTGSIVGLIGLIGVLVAALGADGLLLPSLFVTGAGTGIFMGSNTTALLLALPEHSIGVGNAVRLMLQNVGNLLSVAVSLALIAGVLPRSQRDAVMQADASALDGGAAADLAPGFTAALAFLVGLSVLGVLSCISGWRTARASRVDHSISAK